MACACTMRTGTARSSPRACLVRLRPAQLQCKSTHARGGRCSDADACRGGMAPMCRGTEAHLWPAVFAQGHCVRDATWRGRQVDCRRPAGLRPLVEVLTVPGSIICSSRPGAPLPRRVVAADSIRAVRSSAQLQGLCALPGYLPKRSASCVLRARSQTTDTRVACMRSFVISTRRLHYCEHKP